MSSSTRQTRVIDLHADDPHRDHHTPLIGSGFALPFRDQSLDLVVSGLSLHLVNDLPGVLAQIRRALRPDGLLLAAMVGGDTLTELRQSFAAAEAECEGGVSPRVAPFADLRDVARPGHGRGEVAPRERRRVVEDVFQTQASARSSRGPRESQNH